MCDAVRIHDTDVLIEVRRRIGQRPLDSRWILYNSPEGTIQKIRPSGTGRQSIVAASDGFGGHKPWYSPDGTKILLSLVPESLRDFTQLVAPAILCTTAWWVPAR